MVRPSALPVAQYCGYAVTLSNKYKESSINAEKGTAFHARMAAYIRLVNAGKAPREPGLSAILASLPKYKTIEEEVPVSISGKDGHLTSGTIDVVMTHDDGSVTVLDWKTGNPGIVDFPDENLQLLAYGLGVALTRKAPRFRRALFFTQAPPIQIGKWVHERDYEVMLRKIEDACSRDPEVPVVGPHCDKCFSRKHCRAWMLPAFEGESALVPFSEKGGGITKENAPKALHTFLSFKDSVKTIEALLKDYVRENGPIIEGNKEWGPVLVNGRQSISFDVCQEAGILDKLWEIGAVNRGHKYEAFRWRNVNGRGEKARGGADE